MKTINSYKVLSLVDSYQEYPIPRIFGDDHYYTFIHGSLYGLFCLSDKNTVNLLGINNSKKHNDSSNYLRSLQERMVSSS